jgi:hypothetical protein
MIQNSKVHDFNKRMARLNGQEKQSHDSKKMAHAKMNGVHVPVISEQELEEKKKYYEDLLKNRDSYFDEVNDKSPESPTKITRIVEREKETKIVDTGRERKESLSG